MNQRISELSPGYYIASTSKEKMPSPALIETFGTKVFATFNSGTIKFITNGTELVPTLDSESNLSSYMRAQERASEEAARAEEEEPAEEDEL